MKREAIFRVQRYIKTAIFIYLCKKYLQMKPSSRLLASAAIAAAMILSGVTAVAASGPQLWEEVAADRNDIATSDESGLELTVRDGIVHLTLSRSMTVEVFTILGQPVGRQSLRPGIYRLRLSSRGIYILRAGGITRRITI